MCGYVWSTEGRQVVTFCRIWYRPAVKIRSPLLTKLAARLAVLVVRVLFRTLRIDVRASIPEANPYIVPKHERYLFCVWHDSLLMAVFSGKVHSTAALVSRHQDGSYLAESMKLVGITSIRGSTSRGGATAMKQLMTQTEGKHITITPDGPRGPRREMKKGIVFLASYSGRSIVPVACCCERAWYVQGSWTDLAIPKPFSRVIAMSGTPIHVPPNLSRGELEAYAAIVQHAMDELSTKAESLAGRTTEGPRSERKRAA